MAEKKNTGNKIRYSEPAGYFPKDVQKMFEKKSAVKKTTQKKSK